MRKVKVLFRMLALVKPLAGFMILAVTLGTLGYLTAQFIPILGGYAVLEGLGLNTQNSLSFKTIVILLLIFALLRSIFRFSEQRTNHYIAFRLLAIIRDKVFKALRRLCPAKLEGKDKGDLISLITSDVELLEVFYAHTISPICIGILTETIMCIFIGSFHPLLALVACLSYITVGVILPLIISKRSGKLGESLRAESGMLASHMLESIRGIDESLQYNGGEKRLKEISEKTKALSQKQGVLNRLNGTNLSLTNTFIWLSDLVMMAVGIYLYTSRKVSFEGFLIPMIALMSSFGPVSALSALGTSLQSTIASGARVLAVIDEEAETEDISDKELLSFDGQAQVENLSFAYGEEKVLNNISLKINKGEILGIMGPSGCGKSTLLKIFMRFWKTKEGSIKISGRDIEEINTENLHDIESYMTQETQIFKDTIANNIRIGKLNASDAEVVEACKNASIHDFIISLPKGYNTEVGELGSTLSSGEKQRIGLARAFLHNAPFMILDEPTSSLDSLNEAVILKALKNCAQDKTILLVSHRKSTMCIADQSLSMDKGRLS